MHKTISQIAMKLQRCTTIHNTALYLTRHSSSLNDEPKTRVRFSVRQKRPDAKGALKDLLLNNGASYRHDFQGEDLNCGSRGGRKNTRVEDSSHDNGRKQPSKDNIRLKQRSTPKRKHSKGRRRGEFSDDDDWKFPDTKISAKWGGQRTFTWSFGSEENLHFDNSTNGFQWQRDSSRDKGRRKIWSESDVSDGEEVSTKLDLESSHRVTLGLPASGCLDLDEVKRTFHACALRWHPDKHQGTSQVIAQEKFKLCVEAYKSLCNILKSR